MTSALELFGHHLSATRLLLYVLLLVVVLAVAAGALGRWFVKRGLHKPRVVRLINRASAAVIEVVKRPITIAVLDEVVDVLQTGHYTRNVRAALQENHTELVAMFAEKLKQDRTTRAVNLIPFHDAIINEVSETVLRVVMEILADPRTDELVADVLRDNVIQIRAAVKADQNR